jgi:putative ABC transport system permease protein
MLQNYLTIALRTIQRQKLFTAINVLGLALGLAASLLVALYVNDEYSYERFHLNADRIVRVVGGQTNNGVPMYKGALMPPLLADMLVSTYPEVEAATRFGTFAAELAVGNIVIPGSPETEGAQVDSSFLQMFSFPVLYGSPVIGKQATTIVLTRSLATTLFGNPANAVGKTVNFMKTPLPVSAVLEDVPKNSHLRFTYLIPYQMQEMHKHWESNVMSLYVLLRPNANKQAFNASIGAIGKKYIAPALKKYNASWSWEQETEPLLDIRLHTTLTGQQGTAQHVSIFALAGILTLLLACINYVNLATARSLLRAREVGIRKTLGATRVRIMLQFFSESAGLVVVSFLLAACLLEVALPFFNTLTGKTFATADLFQGRFLAIAATTVVFTIVASGSYAAFALSAFRPIDVLKIGFRGTTNGIGLRQGLVVAQFSIAVALITGIVVIGLQLRFMQTASLGFTKEHVAAVYPDRRTAQTFQQQVNAISGVMATDLTFQTPAVWTGAAKLNVNGANERGSQSATAELYAVGKNYQQTLEIPLLQGRFFGQTSDSAGAIVVNEAFVKAMNWTSPLGQTVRYEFNSKPKTAQVVGVVGDFHSKSFRDAITPIMMEPTNRGSILLVRMQAGQMQSVIAGITKLYNSTPQELPLQVRFLDDEFDKYYEGEKNLAQTISALTVVAVVIACLGLFGLAAFAAERRTKEIGIRKVLGASVASIIALLSKDFLVLVGIAIIIAMPLAYWFAGKWLQDFAYRVELTWWVFAVAGGLAVVIAFATVATQAWKAARQNPVNALRSE